MIGIIGIDDAHWHRLAKIDPRLATTRREDVLNLPPQRLDDYTGLLLSAPNSSDSNLRYDAVETTRRFLNSAKPVLAFANGAYILNHAIEDTDSDIERRLAEADDTIPDAGLGKPTRTTLFLTVGSKTAMTIGGSGWLTIRDVVIQPIPIARLSQLLMPSAFTEDSAVAAFEMAGHSWTIGVTWDIAESAAMPKGFTNLLEAFVDRIED